MLGCASICPELTHQKLESQRVLFNPFNYGFVYDILSEDLCRCGFNYIAIIRKTKRAITLVFAMQTCDI